MMYGDMRHYANGRKKKYNAWGKKSETTPSSTRTFVPDYSYRRGRTDHIKSVMTSVSVAETAKPARKEYTGTLIKGISTMHKSNAVPIIDEQEMKDHANMRR